MGRSVTVERDGKTLFVRFFCLHGMRDWCQRGYPVFWVRLWSNGPGLHVRWRATRADLLFSERMGITRVHRCGRLWWKLLRGD